MGYLRRVADVAAEYDCTVCIEIHVGRLVEAADSTVQFLYLVDRENVGVIHDAGNMYTVDADYGWESVERLGESFVHVKGPVDRRCVGRECVRTGDEPRRGDLPAPLARREHS